MKFTGEQITAVKQLSVLTKSDKNSRNSFTIPDYAVGQLIPDYWPVI